MHYAQLKNNINQGYYLFRKTAKKKCKIFLNDYTSNYKNGLISLQLLPLMMQLEINDVVFFIKSLKEPTHTFNIMNNFLLVVQDLEN